MPPTDMAERTTDHARAEAAFAEFRRTGSPRAMAEVFDRTATGLLLFARRFARDAAAAEDLVQQTFLRAIERAATFAPDRQLMPWLTTILANEARMELRRRRMPDPDRLPQSMSEEPSLTAERHEAAAALHAALAQLPPALLRCRCPALPARHATWTHRRRDRIASADGENPPEPRRAQARRQPAARPRVRHRGGAVRGSRAARHPARGDAMHGRLGCWCLDVYRIARHEEDRPADRHRRTGC